jgi:hypothetical protein
LAEKRSYFRLKIATKTDSLIDSKSPFYGSVSAEISLKNCRGQFFKRIFARTEKLAMLGSAQFKPMQ